MATLTATATETGDYSGSVSSTFTIKQADLTVKANDQSITYGGSIATSKDQVAATGLVGGDTLESVTLTPSSDQVAVADKTITPFAAKIQNSSGADSTMEYSTDGGTTWNKNVVWSTSDLSVAAVDSSGNVTARAPGTAVITVTTRSGSHKATCTVTVVSVSYTVTYAPNGGTGTMTAGTALGGTAFVLPECGFTAPVGKAFDAWAIGSVSGEKAAAGSGYMFTADTTVCMWRNRSGYGQTSPPSSKGHRPSGPARRP